MLRNMAFLLVGAVLGGAGMWLVASGDASSGASGGTAESFLAAIRGLGQRSAAPAAVVPSIDDRLKTLRSIATSDPAALEARLAVLAAEPWSPAGALEIDALLTRLADVAPDRAATVALAAGLEPEFVARAWRYWAEADPDAAIGALDRIRDAGARRLAALALLDVIGDLPTSVDRLAAALPARDRDAFRADWLARRAANDPYGALRAALAQDDIEAQRSAVQRIGEIWAEQDPLGALLQADQLRDRLSQAAFRSAVSQRWASVDPLGFLAYLQSGAADPEALQGGFQWLAAADPDALFDLADRFSGTAARDLRMIAIYEVAAYDPEAALARVEAMPRSQDRDMMLSQVASRYAETDPAAALDWARSLDPPAPDVLNNVVQNVVMRDPGLAAELIADPPPGVDVQFVSVVIGSIGMQDPVQARQMADLLLEHGDVRSRAALSNVVSGWMRRNEDDALDWIMQNLGSLDARTVGQAAQAMARRDPAGAAGYVDQIPPDFRAAWIAQIAAPYAAYDPAGASAWIAQYQGTPVYATAYRQMILQVAQADADAAALMVSQASPEVQLGAASRVATALAQRDPRAAANWASRLGDPRARSSAVGAVVGAWATADVSAARNWTLDQPAGEPRDRALASVLARLVANGDVDRSLFEQFNSTEIRNETLVQVIPLLARSDREQAREIYDSNLVNGAQRQAIDQRMREIGASF